MTHDTFGLNNYGFKNNESMMMDYDNHSVYGYNQSVLPWRNWQDDNSLMM